MSLVFASLLATAASASVTEEWVARHNSACNGEDFGGAVVADALGNVYVTGRSHVDSEGDDDFVTIKYNSDGDELWTAMHDWGPDDTGGLFIGLDEDGNVYVGGGVVWPDNYDYYVIKYDKEGVEQWTYRYNCVPDGWEELRDMAVDAAGNVYLTGTSDGGPETHYDCATVKLDTDGSALWVSRFNGPASESEVAQSIAVDDSGDVFVTALSRRTEAGSLDYATIKYDPEGGQQWIAWMDGLDYDPDLDVAALAVDDAGYVYVAGGSGPAHEEDFFTVKYGTDGTEIWTVDYDGPAGDSDVALAVDVDEAGSVYVCGIETVVADSEFQYVTIKYDNEGTEKWVAERAGPSMHCGLDPWRLCRLAASGGTAFVALQNDCDYVTIAYDSLGGEEWVQTYDGPASGVDWPLGIALGTEGSVYVTGLSLGVGTDLDCATVKYSPDDTPVESAFYAELTGTGTAVLRWVVPSVDQFSGINVYRRTSREGPFVLVNDTPLEASSPGAFEDVSVWAGTTFWYELRLILADGASEVSVGSLVSVTTLGELKLALSPGRPNPSRGVIRFDVEIPESSCPARLLVYNARGALVRTLIDGLDEPGRTTATWDGTNWFGRRVPNGVYFFRLVAGRRSVTRRVTVIR
jgi:hypothetical protein